jgi:CYTH domain-containing protein
MALEIERKFLVDADFMAEATSSSRIVQGYLASSPSASVRVRIYGEKGYMTVKGRISQSGMSRFEWEKEIPVDEALSLLMLCGGGVIDKVRHIVPFGGHEFEVDVFAGANEGLILAELELSSEDESFEKPSWLGQEVTGDMRYHNSMLLKHPYNKWYK